jgi:hypothetical protein
VAIEWADTAGITALVVIARADRVPAPAEIALIVTAFAFAGALASSAPPASTKATAPLRSVLFIVSILSNGISPLRLN